MQFTLHIKPPVSKEYRPPYAPGAELPYDGSKGRFFRPSEDMQALGEAAKNFAVLAGLGRQHESVVITVAPSETGVLRIYFETKKPWSAVLPRALERKAAGDEHFTQGFVAGLRCNPGIDFAWHDKGFGDPDIKENSPFLQFRTIKDAQDFFAALPKDKNLGWSL